VATLRYAGSGLMLDKRTTRKALSPAQPGAAETSHVSRRLPAMPPATGRMRISNRQTRRAVTPVTRSKQTTGPISNRQEMKALVFMFRAPAARCAAGTRAIRYRCSPPNPVCYSHRRTRVPPNGSRATAPARPSPEVSRLLRCRLRRQPAASLATRPSPDSPRRFLCAFLHQPKTNASTK
jgi:hypothetical protein